MAEIKDLIVERLHQSPPDGFFELFENDPIDLNFHYYRYLACNPKILSVVQRYSRDTPLHMAVRIGSIELVQFILSKGLGQKVKNEFKDNLKNNVKDQAQAQIQIYKMVMAILLLMLPFKLEIDQFWRF